MAWQRRWLAAGAVVMTVLAGCSWLPSSATPESVTTGPGTWVSGTPAAAPTVTVSLTASEVLGRLPIADWAPETGYNRDAFGQRWSDDIDVDGGHNGCDQRSDTLRRDLQDIVIKPRTQGCVPAAGTLQDPYTGAVIAFARGADTSAEVQIDHVVALSNAWRTGAQQWTTQRRQDFAGDPLELLAVDGPTNQAKSDDDASEWLPPRGEFRCPYVARQIAVKARYGLWVTHAEAAAMSAVLSGCPGEQLPVDTDVPAPVR
jgi:hypothetical protein